MRIVSKVSKYASHSYIGEKELRDSCEKSCVKSRIKTKTEKRGAYIAKN